MSQRNFEDAWVDVKIGDVFTENNRIRTGLNASLVLNDGTKTITIPGGREGRIDSLLRMR